MTSYWRKQDDGERANGTFCRAALDDGAVHKGYVCEKKDGTYGWRVATTAEIATGSLCEFGTITKVNNGYVCEYGTAEWRQAFAVEIETDTVCGIRKTNKYLGATTESSDHLFAGKYICSRNGTGKCLSDKINGYCWRKED